MMEDGFFNFLRSAPAPIRILVILVLAAAVHVLVLLIRRLSALARARVRPGLSRVRTLGTLLTSFTVFCLYFLAIGMILRELGISLKAYLASASIVGLAIGFGSQGLVQDVVTGLTLVFSNLFDVGGMVEISGQTGIVQSVGMRFTVIENAFGAKVYIPNRTISNVISYPSGYVRGIVDVMLSDDPGIAEKMVDTITSVADSAFERLPGIFMTPPTVVGQIRTSSGRTYLRLKFRLWPGRGTPIEQTLKPEIANALRQHESTFADWMIAVNYEVEKKNQPLPQPRGRGPK